MLGIQKRSSILGIRDYEELQQEAQKVKCPDCCANENEQCHNLFDSKLMVEPHISRVRKVMSMSEKIRYA